MTEKKEKTCFVIMPISDIFGYELGHFRRVYTHIIKPACEEAGFIPIRADDILTTNYIAIDIIKKIINSDMSICDLSGRNPNVLYELGIRQAFNLPVTLIKDKKTERIFDIQGFRDIEYDESLRIDTVEESINSLSEVMLNTHKNRDEINSLVSLLGIEPAKITNKTEISIDTDILLKAINNLEKRISETTRPSINQTNKIWELAIPDAKYRNIGEYFTKDELAFLKVGDHVFSENFGFGIISHLVKNNNDQNKIAEIKFSTGVKRILLRYSKLRKVILSSNRLDPVP